MRKNIKRTALYVAWRDMMKRAKHEFILNEKYKINKPYPVDEELFDFDKFALIVQLEGYTIGIDDDKIILRKDFTKPFDFDNIKFVTYSEYIDEVERLRLLYKEQKDEKRHAEKMSKSRSCTRLYEIWRGMKRRCNDPKCKDFQDYGGRGISVCNEWLDFERFYDWAWDHGYDPQLSIDRIDVNGNYCPSNCRWATPLEQMLNKRKYNGLYKNVRLNVKRMRGMLEVMPDDAVVTLVARTDMLPEIHFEDDFQSVPYEDRIDSFRAK